MLWLSRNPLALARGGCQCHKETETYVLLCNFISNFYKYALCENDIRQFVQDIRNLEQMKWLENLKAPQPFVSDKELLRILDFELSKVANQAEFFNSDDLDKFLRERGDEAFYEMLRNVRPDDWHKFKDKPTNGELFWAVLDKALNSDDKDKIMQIYELICQEVRKQSIIAAESKCRESIDEMRDILEK